MIDSSLPIPAGGFVVLGINADEDGANWCPATDLLPQGDRGSPGAINPDCL